MGFSRRWDRVPSARRRLYAQGIPVSHTRHLTEMQLSVRTSPFCHWFAGCKHGLVCRNTSIQGYGAFDFCRCAMP
ncbi:hypothetical protein CDEST_14137 [Colletotrichum destructivum]|uniref:Uncharacterized protein n=1 Tax=Colletotrichum destructivum TaxID=34406 RepID=A0AAX4J135_9PEZI|nr:hypothetical protein CDEST_14137 [Colletotrichum destructivum]